MREGGKRRGKGENEKGEGEGVKERQMEGKMKRV